MNDRRRARDDDIVEQIGVEDRALDQLDAVESLEVGLRLPVERSSRATTWATCRTARIGTQVGTDETGPSGDHDPAIPVRPDPFVPAAGADRLPRSTRCTGRGYSRSTVGPSRRFRVSST